MINTIAVLFVLYYPSNDDIEYIKTCEQCFSHCYIFDNTPQSNLSEVDFNKSVVYSDGINHGLAYAYNTVLEDAYNKGIKWLGIFDQDSRVKSFHDIENYIIKAQPNEAIICPFIIYSDKDKIPLQEKEEINWTINSGSFLNVMYLREHNICYDEYYFLDRLDLDFCTQIRNQKGHIIRINSYILNQKLGERVKNTNIHSPQRNYYIARNRLYYNKKYYRYLKRILMDLVPLFKHIFGILIVHENTKKNINAVIMGIHDYFHKVSGKKDI